MKPPCVAQHTSCPAVHDIIPQSILPGVDIIVPPESCCIIPESFMFIDESVIVEESVGFIEPSGLLLFPPSVISVLPPQATSAVVRRMKQVRMRVV